MILTRELFRAIAAAKLDRYLKESTRRLIENDVLSQVESGALRIEEAAGVLDAALQEVARECGEARTRLLARMELALDRGVSAIDLLSEIEA